MTRVTAVALLVPLLVGCAESFRTVTYDPRRACEAFSGRYVESDGTCRHGGL